MWYGKLDAVMVGQLFPCLDSPDRLNHDAVSGRVSAGTFEHYCLAVRIAAVIYPARRVTTNSRVDHVVIIQRKEESVAAVDILTERRICLRVR